MMPSDIGIITSESIRIPINQPVFHGIVQEHAIAAAQQYIEIHC